MTSLCKHHIWHKITINIDFQTWQAQPKTIHQKLLIKNNNMRYLLTHAFGDNDGCDFVVAVILNSN